jgi:hypothetical protein
MHTILTSYELDAARRSLVRELADVDGRQLLDMGLVRGPDGALYLAEDPSQQVAPDPLVRRFRAFLVGIAGFFRWLRGLPLKSQNWSPPFFLRE